MSKLEVYVILTRPSCSRLHPVGARSLHQGICQNKYILRAAVFSPVLCCTLHDKLSAPLIETPGVLT
jgi:hypothetical protein